MVKIVCLYNGMLYLFTIRTPPDLRSLGFIELKFNSEENSMGFILTSFLEAIQAPAMPNLLFSERRPGRAQRNRARNPTEVRMRYLLGKF